MSLFTRIADALGLGIGPDPFTLDNVPVKALEIDWREEAVKKAAERHGKPFLCAVDGVPRERFVGKAMEKEIVRPTATVHSIRRNSKEK